MIPFSFIKYLNVFSGNCSVKLMYLVVIYCSEMIVLEGILLKEVRIIMITSGFTVYILIYVMFNFHR